MANAKPKMAPASTDEQFKFLISCIRFSNNGKVSNWSLVSSHPHIRDSSPLGPNATGREREDEEC